jgi:DNA-binding transcriptional MerR regulator
VSNTTVQQIDPAPAAQRQALRSISAAAAELDVEPHVLRFWERKFVQINPLKRSGGRRYYSAADIEILRRIRTLLYNDGLSIRGAQRLLDSEGGRMSLRNEEAEVMAQVQPVAVNAPRALPSPRPRATRSGEGPRRHEIETALRDLQTALLELRDTLSATGTTGRQ